MAAGLRRPCGASSPAACGACVRTRRRSCGRKEAPCASPGGAFGHVGTCEHTRTRGRAHGGEPLASALRPSLRRFAACGPCAVDGPGFESRVADVPPRSEGQAGRPWTELPRFRRFCASWSFPAERCMESAWSQPTISYYLQSKIKNRGDFVQPIWRSDAHPSSTRPKLIVRRNRRPPSPKTAKSPPASPVALLAVHHKAGVIQADHGR